MHNTLKQILQYRRSIRNYLPDPVPDEVILSCIESAILAPSSSNLQLWEYYHVKSPNKKTALVKACLNQPAARTAPNLIVVVARHDLWRQRCQANLTDFAEAEKVDPIEKMIKASTYYSKTIPTLYMEFFGIFGFFKKIFRLNRQI